MTDLVAVLPPLEYYRLTFQRRHGKGHRRQEESVLVQARDAEELQAIKRGIPGRILSVERPRLHTCSKCGKVEPWGPEWSWYGSYKQLDDGEPVRKLCSRACGSRVDLAENKEE